MQRLLGLLSFRGRLSRLAFWRAYLLLMALGVGNLLLACTAIIYVHVAFAVLLAPMLAILAANIAITVRRLHDRARSGWWILPFFVLPGVIGAVLSDLDAPVGPWLALVLGLAALALEIWGVVEVGFLSGKPGPNRYGLTPPRRALFA